MDDKPVDKETTFVRTEIEGTLGSRFQVGHQLGKGGAGIIFEITDKMNENKRVVKVLRPSAREIEQLKQEFFGEAQRLAQLRHSNLVTVFEQGPKLPPPYFIMEYIKGNQLNAAIPTLAKEKPRGLWIKEVRTIFFQLSDVLAYLHLRPKPLLHLDIKPENIILAYDYLGNPQPILLDFGISRFADGTEAGSEPVRAFGTFPMWPQKYLRTLERKTETGRTVFLINRDAINTDLDLHLLGKTIALILDLGKRHDPQFDQLDSAADAELKVLTETILRLDMDKSEEPKFESAIQLRQALGRLELRASRIRRPLEDGYVKLPGLDVASFGRKVRTLTDWPKFQRLRGIHQLGFTYLVFPGAVHTRLEHSLGVFEIATRFLDQITGPDGDCRFRSLVSDEELIATAIVALYHDIGHYPYAHQFRFRGEFPRHVERTLAVMESGEVAKMITTAFNQDVYHACLNIMKLINAYESPGTPKPQGDAIPAHYKVLRSVVSSTLDADKLDYVDRDAVHSGVPYGRIVDRQRFLKSLRIWWRGNDPQLLLSDKGRVCAEGLVFARYLMTSEVYWNHAVRAYAAMLTAAIALVEPGEVEDHLWDTDSSFLAWLGTNKNTEWFNSLINSRTPYRRAFVHQRRGGNEAQVATDERLFRFLEKSVGESAAAMAEVQRIVAEVLRLKDWQPHEIVMDIPEGMTRIVGVQVLPEGHEEPGRVGPIYEAIGENFDGFARKARIFVHPRLMERRKVAESTRIVREALIEEFQLS